MTSRVRSAEKPNHQISMVISMGSEGDTAAPIRLPVLDRPARPAHDSRMTTSSQQQRSAPHSEIIFADVPGELATTRRLLERYPDGKGDWKPDPKSRSLGELASHIADIAGYGAFVLELPELNAAAHTRAPQLDSAAALLDRFDQNAARVIDALPRTTDEAMAQPWTFRFGDHVIFTLPRRDALRRFLVSHIIHHRAQLATYYRTLGIPVPGIYGPSADEQ